MSTPKEVACSFILSYFETLASNPSELADLYSHQSSFTVVDFEYGTTESYGSDIPKVLEQWAQIFDGCKLTVNSFVAHALYTGVSVVVSFSANSGKVEHFFQLVANLESCASPDYGAESYFVRNQVVLRVGAVVAEEPAEEPAVVPEPEAEPEAEAEAEVEAEAVPEPAVEAAAPATAAPQEAEEAAEPPAKKAKESQPAAAPRAAKPKSWASLAGAVPSKSEQRPQMKVVAFGKRPKAEAVETAAETQQQDTKEEKAAPAKSFTKGPRAPLPPIGDRVMFNVGHSVTDDEIKASLRSYAANIVSLRNNSANGHVFIDFAANVSVMDDLKSNPPVIGVQKTRVNVYRQKVREQ